MQLEPIMKKAIKTALSEGVNDAEVFAVRSRTLSVYIDDNAIKNVEEKTDQGLSVRVIRAKKVGQASSTYSNVRDSESCAVKAVKLAGVSQPDPIFKNFPMSEKGAGVPNVYDRAVSGMDADTITELGKEHSRFRCGRRQCQGTQWPDSGCRYPVDAGEHERGRDRDPQHDDLCPFYLHDRRGEARGRREELLLATPGWFRFNGIR